jgi:hypothetical protein
MVIPSSSTNRTASDPIGRCGALGAGRRRRKRIEGAAVPAFRRVETRLTHRLNAQLLAALVTAGLVMGSLSLLTAPARAADAAAATAEQRAAQLLEAMGGKTRWAKVRGITVEAVHWTERLAAPHDNAIVNDFTAPRVRFTAKGAGLNRVRVIDGDTGWRRDAGGPVESMTPEAVAEDWSWWEANVYRTLHRLAAGDRTLSVRLHPEGFLEVWVTAENRRLNWFRLNAAGEPVQFGTGSPGDGNVFGPLTEVNGLRYPRWGTNRTGGWRYEVIRVVPTESPPVVDTARPAG